MGSDLYLVRGLIKQPLKFLHFRNIIYEKAEDLGPGQSNLGDHM